MFALVNTEEQSFNSLGELRDVIAGQDRRDYEMPVCSISLDQDGIVHAGRFEGPLIKPALYGLLNTLGIPADFALNHCPEDLLVAIVQRIARDLNTMLRIQSTNGVVTGIMPAERQPIRHDVLIDWLGVKRPVKEATLGAGCLRITAVSTESEELLPNDTFAFGWELKSSENGWQSTEVWRWVLREVCTNGMVGFERDPIFRRKCQSREPVFKSLEEIAHVVQEASVPAGFFESAIKWAVERHVGKEHKLVFNYLAQRLEGDATKLALGEITADTSWYELMNTVTSLAKLHRIEMRRRYEAEGGMLLNWFSRQGQGRPPWRKVSCEECEAWNIN